MDLFFDTETTGFPKRDLPLDAKEQPDVIQLGALLVDGRSTVGEMNLIIYPRGEIPPETTEVHGISLDLATRSGVFPGTAISIFQQWLMHADRLIAHNLFFDRVHMKMMYAREWHEAYDDSALVRICTMRSATDLCQIPHASGRAGYKWPKLEEAYQWLFNETFNAHDALADTRACARVLWALEDMGHPLWIYKNEGKEGQ